MVQNKSLDNEGFGAQTKGEFEKPKILTYMFLMFFNFGKLFFSHGGSNVVFKYSAIYCV